MDEYIHRLHGYLIALDEEINTVSHSRADALTGILVMRAERTEPDYSKCLPRFTEESIRLLHAAMGLVTEAAEFLDPLKKWFYYGREIDRTNMIEELGDSNWYERIACSALEIRFLEMIERNVRKLQARYPEKFTEEAANDRNLAEERRALEMISAWDSPPAPIASPSLITNIRTDLDKILEEFIPTRVVHGGVEDDDDLRYRMPEGDRLFLLRRLEEYIKAMVARKGAESPFEDNDE